MRSFIKSVFLWAAVICILPAAAAGGVREDRRVSVPAAQSVILPEERTLRLLCESTGEITETDMEEYAVFAVLEEVPFIPDDEALKAQVCAARTYAARRILSGENESGAHISDDCSRYQTALSEADARAIYGGDYDTALSAVRAAAKETEGEIIMYGNAPAIAAFHISSAGKTESAESVWGKAYPYLISVPSDCTEVRSEFTKAEIAARIVSEYSEASEYDEIKVLSISEAGTVLAVEVCGVTVSGGRLAELLSLDSAAFEVIESDENVIFTARGNGHLVGMSICGADKLSREGKSYREILEHYYPGTYTLKMQ